MNTISAAHAIDCDVHPQVPGMGALLPYLDPFWRESVEARGIEFARQHQLSAGRADFGAGGFS